MVYMYTGVVYRVVYRCGIQGWYTGVVYRGGI